MTKQAAHISQKPSKQSLLSDYLTPNATGATSFALAANSLKPDSQRSDANYDTVVVPAWDLHDSSVKGNTDPY